MLTNQKDFCEKYNIDEIAYTKTGLQWKSLEDIYNDYMIFKEELEHSAIFLFNSLMKAENVHSVRYRIKDPEHLIEKIIRKKIEDIKSNITLKNYKENVTDLIGLRALHLYKDDWETINDYIRRLWNLKEKPVANYRKGDSPEWIDFFTQKDCDIKEHKYGYRSVHYLIETQPAKQKFYAEIQVRTIFEEAWAEIDHTIRYPYDLDNVIFFQFILILNRLAGSADEMGSYIKFLKKELSGKEDQFKEQIDEKTQIILDLEEKLDKLQLNDKELKEVKSDLERLKSQKVGSIPYWLGSGLGSSDYLKSNSILQNSIGGLNLETFLNLQKITPPTGYQSVLTSQQITDSPFIPKTSNIPSPAALDKTIKKKPKGEK